MQKLPNTPILFTLFAIRKYLWWFIAATIFIVFIEILGGAANFSIQKIVDSANGYVDGTTALKTVFLWTLALPVFRLGYSMFLRLSGFIMNYLTVHARTRTARILFEYLSDHSLAYFSDRFAGSLGSRVDTIANNVVRLLSQFLWNVVSSFSMIFVNLGLIFTVDLRIGLLILGAFVLLVPINLKLTRKQVELSEKMSETKAKLRGQLIDTVSNIIAVQQFARKQMELLRLDKSINEHRDADIRSDNYREWVLLINNLIAALIIGAASIWTFFLWSDGTITLGQFIMAISLMGSIMWSLTFIGQWLNSIMESYGELRDGLKEIVVPHQVTSQENAKKLQVEDGTIEFTHVNFNYPDTKIQTFENLNLHIPGGQKVGIVGTSGAGKTTLMKLLLRQYDVSNGAITIDGQNIAQVTLESLRENISIVPQEPILFHRSIRENILYGKPNAKRSDMIDVAKKAQAHDFISELEDKYESMVGERGVKLSVGQRQRIAIARAFLKDAPILILDEATSALDSESEIAVQNALHHLMEGKTVLAIAHRLSTLREMDRILVFKDGNIVEDGSHEELIKKGGAYTSLWEHQAGGFLKEN